LIKMLKLTLDVSDDKFAINRSWLDDLVLPFNLRYVDVAAGESVVTEILPKPFNI
jgi:hypothetical protein